MATGLLLVFILLYLMPLDIRPLAIPDETRYAEIPYEMLESGDWVTVEFTVRGTNTGPFMGPEGELPPSNQAVELQSCDVLHVENGQVTGGRSYFDLNTVTRQLEA